jgi:ankyrin repeat protein
VGASSRVHKADVATQSNDGWTALHFASQNGHGEVVDRLLVAKADVATQAEDGWTALHCAAWHGHSQIANSLRRALSSSSYMSDEQNISDPSETSSTNAIDLLESLVLAYPDDSTLRRSLGNEYIRQKRYTEANTAFDMSMHITMKNIKATRVDDITTDVSCEDCGQPVRGCHYKCVQCGWNHDLCQACFQKSNHPHPLADFIMIPSKDFAVAGE